MRKLLSLFMLLLAVSAVAQQPINVNQVGGKPISLYATMFSAQAATGTATSSATRIPGFSGYGSLAITGSSITGSPAGCQVTLKYQQNTATTAGSAFYTQTFTPGNSYQNFQVLPSLTANATGDTLIATYSCTTYPTAGTITVTFTPYAPVAVVPSSINCDSTIVYDASTSGSTQLVALTTGKTIRVCGYSFFAAGTVNVKLTYGTGSNCGTGTTSITPAYQFTTQTGLVDSSPVWRGLSTAVSNALCINTSGAVAVQAIVYYTSVQ